MYDSTRDSLPGVEKKLVLIFIKWWWKKKRTVEIVKKTFGVEFSP